MQGSCPLSFRASQSSSHCGQSVALARPGRRLPGDSAGLAFFCLIKHSTPWASTGKIPFAPEIRHTFNTAHSGLRPPGADGQRMRDLP